MIWIQFQTRPVNLGLLPSFLSEDDPAPAREQIHKRYAHGGGWQAIDGCRIEHGFILRSIFPEDPPLRPLAIAKLRTETILLYPGDFVAIVQADGRHEVARID